MPWLSYYPRDPPVKTIWPAAYIGQTHTVSTPAGYFTCDPNSWSGNCAEAPELTLKLQVVSLRPRVFVIEKLLSPWECDHIVELGKTGCGPLWWETRVASRARRAPRAPGGCAGIMTRPSRRCLTALPTCWALIGRPVGTPRSCRSCGARGGRSTHHTTTSVTMGCRMCGI